MDHLMVQRATQAFREADQWWMYFEVAVSRYRQWVLIWAARSRALNRLRGRVAGPRLLHLCQLVDEAHDRALVEADALQSASRSARACEMAGRIYHEEYDGCEAYRLKREEEDDRE